MSEQRAYTGDWPGNGESPAAYRARRRAAGLFYYEPCPGCPDRLASPESHGERVHITITVEIQPAGARDGAPDIDADGYLIGTICGLCDVWRRSEGDRQKAARQRADEVEERIRQARIAEAEKDAKRRALYGQQGRFEMHRGGRE